jgi:hypothetical protein
LVGEFVPFVSRKGAKRNKGEAKISNVSSPLALASFNGFAKSLFSFAPLRQTDGTTTQSGATRLAQTGITA